MWQQPPSDGVKTAETKRNGANMFTWKRSWGGAATFPRCFLPHARRCATSPPLPARQLDPRVESRSYLNIDVSWSFEVFSWLFMSSSYYVSETNERTDGRGRTRGQNGRYLFPGYIRMEYFIFLLRQPSRNCLMCSNYIFVISLWRARW